MQKEIEKAERELKIRNYSSKTIKSYLHGLREYLFFKGRDHTDLDQENIRDFLLYCQERNISPQSRDLYLSAIKFYYRNVLKNNEKILIKTAKTPKYLPTVLSRNEVKRIIGSSANPKHKLMLLLSYGAGLRVSEVVNLKVKDLDLEDLIVRIR